MRSASLLLVALVAAAGCLQSDAPAPGPSPSMAPLPPPVKQVLSLEGNNALCSEVLTNPTTAPFDLEDAYDQLEVTWHASGLGQVRYEIHSPDGSLVDSMPDTNPTNQPCTHAHEGGAKTLSGLKPGRYEATVYNTGILGWHLLVNEKSSQSNATGGEHPHT